MNSDYLNSKQKTKKSTTKHPFIINDLMSNMIQTSVSEDLLRSFNKKEKSTFFFFCHKGIYGQTQIHKCLIFYTYVRQKGLKSLYR